MNSRTAYRSTFPGGEANSGIQGTDVEFEEQYAKSSARAKVLEDLEDGSVNPLISHNSKINIAYNPMNNGNLESGMMRIRKGIMP